MIVSAAFLQLQVFTCLRHTFLKLFLPVRERSLAVPIAAFCTVRFLVQPLGQLNRVLILLRLIAFFVKFCLKHFPDS